MIIIFIIINLIGLLSITLSSNVISNVVDITISNNNNSPSSFLAIESNNMYDKDKDKKTNSHVLSFINMNKKEKKRILILMSDTGGGHRASALSLEKALSQIPELKGSVYSIMDIWTEHGLFPFNTFVKAYRFLAKRPLLWRLFYLYGWFPPTKKMTEILSETKCYESFRNAIKGFKPDLVVSVHPLCQLMPLSIVEEINKENKKEGKPVVPFVTIVTDLGSAHTTWFDKRVTKLFVPSNEVRNAAIKQGIQPNKIINHGLPIRQSFWKPTSKKSARKKLGLKDSLKTVTMMAGGDGVAKLDLIATEVINEIGDQRPDKKTQFIVICGNNKKVMRKLESKSFKSNIDVTIKGFCNNIHEYMAASDILITKAGPGSIAEAMTTGLPLILSSFLPGQEAGNVPFCENQGFGIYCTKPKVIAKRVCDLLDDVTQLEKMSMKAKEFARPNATIAIAKDIANLIL